MNRTKQSGLLRYLPAATLAFVLVFGLFYLMQALINANLVEPEDKEQIKIGDIWQEVKKIEDEPIVRKPDEIETPDEPPPDIPKTTIEMADAGTGIDISSSPPKVDTSAKIEMGGGFSDGDIIPLVAVQPNYPQRAAERGLEGYVVVGFVIQRDGTVRDEKVVESTSSLFDSEALKAARKLKYKPRIIDGNPVEVDHLYKFTFQLEK